MRAGASAATTRGDGLVDNSAAGLDRVAGMRLGRVAEADGGRDAALRPDAGRPLAERRRRNHGDGQRRELQGGEEAREPRPDDDDVAGPERGARIAEARDQFGLAGGRHRQVLLDEGVGPLTVP